MAVRKKEKTAHHRRPEEYKILANQILNLANRGIPKFDFFKQVLVELMNFSGCDAMELWLREIDQFNRHAIHSDEKYTFQVLASEKDGSDLVPVIKQESKLGQGWIEMFKRTSIYPAVMIFPSSDDLKVDFLLRDEFKSSMILAMYFGDEKVGFIQLMSIKKNFFSPDVAELYNILVHDFGVAIVNHRIQSALLERVKELSCLYKIAKTAENPSIEFRDLLQHIMAHIQPAWQYPEITQCRIILDDKEYTTNGFKEHGQKQIADIYIKGARRGALEVVYTEEKPEIFEGPFLREERNLIDTIAAQIALLIERRQAEKDRLELQAQLRHADRLATIGQLAAGVAHELNEPLGNILGFSQLTKKCDNLPDQAVSDIDKIINASLHAREIIKKLMLFARQLPQQSSKINLNQVVEEGLYFFEARCAKSGIDLVRQLTPDLHEFFADKAQLNQVLVNLVVNSIQAMPNGGTLTIKTANAPGHVSLIVEDTGVGMSDEVLNKIFIPFFTTKDVNEGTGLGLAVVHGIVTSHRGRINVESTLNKGSRFDIQFKI